MHLRFIYKKISKLNRQIITLFTLSPYKLIGYANNNYVGNTKDYKLVIKNCCYMNKAIIL